jgi:signal peptidase I
MSTITASIPTGQAPAEPPATGTSATGRRIAAAIRSGRRIARLTGWLVLLAGGLLLVVPTLLGLDRYVIVGGSMGPTIERGSLVFDEDVPVSELAVGDVITYVPPASTGITRFVTHRIVEVDVDDAGMRSFRTKGDANAAADPWTFELPAERQNRVRFTVPFAGHVLLVLSDPSKRVLLIGIPAGLVAVRALLDLVGVRRPTRSTRPVAA